MRIRATVAAVSGALALSALAVPAAQAAGETGTPYTMSSVSFSNFQIAKAIKVGTTNEVSTTYSYTLTHGSDVDVTAPDFYSDAILYRGSLEDPSKTLEGDDFATCTVVTSTTATCTGTIDVYPGDELTNSDPGTWTAAAEAYAFNGQDQQNPDMSKVGFKDQGGLATTLLQRYSKLTVNAGPEPVAKGKTLTATGKLTRANWDTHAYAGYTQQSVKLQFEKAGTTTYTTIKTVTSDSYGNVKATTTANYDGYWRFSFAGTSTTPAVNSSADYVDVQ
ncbi:hypothetical protein [Streptomyces sp. V3I7]|uniref:hypothetical protein n=1 Tax=Streptomyces sp. V3I7 TaxID=3042278 RepID=UPI00277F417A|nr:hypothetical protein [Streptomyces sp. V3I7]MDQ0991528.1 hypothetical protein [Streptomyces sp. V3I7]